MSKSNFKYDLNQEQVVAKFLDNHFYPLLTTDFERFSTMDAQLAGKDVFFSIMNLHKIAVDEKAQTTYINKNLPTFAFEVAFFKDNKLKNGWLFDKFKKTEYYFLIWIKASKDESISVDDITELECLLISIKKYMIFYLREI